MKAGRGYGTPDTRAEICPAAPGEDRGGACFHTVARGDALRDAAAIEREQVPKQPPRAVACGGKPTQEQELWPMCDLPGAVCS